MWILTEITRNRVFFMFLARGDSRLDLIEINWIWSETWAHPVFWYLIKICWRFYALKNEIIAKYGKVPSRGKRFFATAVSSGVSSLAIRLHRVLTICLSNFLFTFIVVWDGRVFNHSEILISYWTCFLTLYFAMS